MNYHFPTINNIDEVLQSIEGRDEFVVKRDDEFTIVNYIVQMEDTFPSVYDNDGVYNHRNALLRECRGITFSNESGQVISRPFHKFFNVNEREETTVAAANIDGWDILEKLDGSMIRPIPVGKHYRLATKMGVTPIAMAAEVFVARHLAYDQFIRHMLTLNVTPIFEWLSPSNRIVILYDEERLVLTALRDNRTGEYLKLDNYNYNVEVVQSYRFDKHVELLQHYLDRAVNFEGFVIRAPNGHMMKMKGDWYLQLHRTKDAIRFEKDVIRLFCTNTFDDLKPMLLPDDKERLENFHRRFMQEVHLTAFRIAEVVREGNKKYDNRRDYAVEFVQKRDEWIRPFLYKFFSPGADVSTGEVLEYVLSTIEKGTGSSTAVERVRHLFNCRLEDDQVE